MNYKKLNTSIQLSLINKHSDWSKLSKLLVKQRQSTKNHCIIRFLVVKKKGGGNKKPRSQLHLVEAEKKKIVLFFK